MKKKLLIGCAALLIAGSFSAGAYAATKMTLIVNGTLANAEPKVINYVTYVPLRAAANLLGADVDFNKATNTVTIKNKGTINVDTYHADNFVFTQLIAEEGQFGWEVSVETGNNGAVGYSGVNFTAVFYNASGKRLGSAFGNVSDIDKGETKFSNMVTSDNLTGFKKVKFQIDVANKK